MNKAFTLVELVITLGVFGIIMIVGSNFLIQTIKNANQAVVQNEVRQNASVIMQDIISQVRNSYCVYYFVDSNDSNSVKIRLSDDPNDSSCNSGNRMEYRQDIVTGEVKKRVIDLAGNTTIWAASPILTSGQIAVLDCSSNGVACGQISGCAAGLVVTSNGLVPSTPLVNGTPATISILAQQFPGQTRADNCASVKLSNTITPRIK